MNDIERGARATYEWALTIGKNLPLWENLNEEQRDAPRRRFRYILASMRVPSENMRIAGHNVRSDPETGMPTHAGVDEIWTAMIDAMLAEETPQEHNCIICVYDDKYEVIGPFESIADLRTWREKWQAQHDRPTCQSVYLADTRAPYCVINPYTKDIKIVGGRFG